MNYAIEMGSDAVIFIPSSIKTGIAIQKLIARAHTQTHTHTHTQQGDLSSLLLFVQNKESRLKSVSLLQLEM
jgi:hypothetical protein